VVVKGHEVRSSSILILKERIVHVCLRMPVFL
jgi:hypothetical protein